MKAKLFTVLLLWVTVQLQAQDYVDVIRLSSNNAVRGNEENDYKTMINNLNLQVYYPIRMSEKLVLLSGFTVENTRLNKFEGAERNNLLMTRLNLGIKYQFSDKWSGIFLALPKIASDFVQIDEQDLQMGGLGLMSYQLSELWSVKFGLYVSSENHGSTITPLLGVWYRSRNRKFYIDAVLPIRADINYSLTSSFSIGADLLTSVKSYSVWINNSDFYTQEESIRVGAYVAYGFLKNTLLLRLRAGLDTTDYGLYQTGDRIGGQILTTPINGDNRNRFNPAFESGFYFGGDLIYRFDLTKEKG